ncbi:MAG: response regulator [Magnetococcus sp. DMHC-6]
MDDSIFSMNLHQARILIVDDQVANNTLLETILKSYGYREIVATTDPREAIRLYGEEKFDIVLLDYHMPFLNGMQVLEKLKELEQSGYLPVLMITAMTDKEIRHQALKIGAQDFITKPFDKFEVVLRVRTVLTVRLLMNKLYTKNQHLIFERDLVEEVLIRLRSHSDFDATRMRLLLTPVEKSNGDFVLAAKRPDGIHHLLVGDFTGHGLAAAVCGPLVSGIFYTMTRNGQDAVHIIQEINRQLCDQLPIHLFLAACFVERNLESHQGRLWNAALPDVNVFHGKILSHHLESGTCPLGITHKISLHANKINFSPEWDTHVFVATDGIVETRSISGDWFGDERLLNFLQEVVATEASLEVILDILAQFRGQGEQKDDITLVEVT